LKDRRIIAIIYIFSFVRMPQVLGQAPCRFLCLASRLPFKKQKRWVGVCVFVFGMLSPTLFILHNKQ